MFVLSVFYIISKKVSHSQQEYVILTFTDYLLEEILL